MATNILNSFPGYEWVWSDEDKSYHNMYRETDVGFGGYIYGEPGIYTDVALLDVASMHPSSIIAMNYFGDYTKNYKDLLDARVAIKHKEYDRAKTMLDGRLAKYLTDEKQAKALSKALKLPLNGAYGLTSAKFNNPMRDERNVNNIVALRGALFMRTLQDEIQNKGFTVASIRTDSVKIPNATPEIIEYVMEFGKQYGYTFEHEATYDRMALVNNSAYVAKYATKEKCQELYGYVPTDNNDHPGEWTATAKQFQVPYVFKSLFSKEEIVFEDLCETFEVKTALYLDRNEELPDVSSYEKELVKLRREIRKSDSALNTMDKGHEAELHRVLARISELEELIATGHDYHFVGRVGQFCPIKPGCGGGDLLRKGVDTAGNDKYDSATGAKGYRWLESEMVRLLEKQAVIDRSYYETLVKDAIDAISAYGDFDWFVSNEPSPKVERGEADLPPWLMACGKETCTGCPHLTLDQFDGDCKLGHDNSDYIYAMTHKDDESPF